MKKLIKGLLLIFLLTSFFEIYSQPIPPPGKKVRTVASGGMLAGRILFGVVVDPTTADVYVASTLATFGVGFNLYKITPAGVVTFIGSYSLGYYQAVKMAWGPDGKIYTLSVGGGGGDNKVYTINPANGAVSVFSNALSLGSPRMSLNFDAAGRLIVGYENMFDFIWAKPAPAAPLILGHVTASVPNGNHGDGFGILQNGDYVVYSDCGSLNNYAISTAGHVDGTPYPTLAWTGTTNIFTIMTGCQYSLGTVDPATNEVFTTINNGGSGNDKIIVTGGSGGASTVYISGGSGITDIYAGKASTGSGNNLYFVDRNTNTVYEVVDCDCVLNGSKNGSFETACALPNSIAFASALDGWTTNDSNFEIWGTGNEGVPAFHLSNYIEINSNFPSTIHQDINTCNGTLYYWQIAHRGRLGTQTVVFEVGPPGGPYVTLATLTTSSAGWAFVSGNYLVPVGQTVTRIRVRGVTGGSVGNFVDAVGFVPFNTCLTQDVDSDGFSANYGDCDDTNNNVKPCAPEICNGIDDDCDGLIDGLDPNFVSTDPNLPNYIDAVLPVVTCPANVTYTTPSGNCGPVPSGSVSLGTATATDNCIVIASIVNNAPGSYPLGVTNVKWTATDKKGNKGTCIQKVTINPYTCGQAIQIYHTDTTTSSAKIKWKAGICGTDYQLRIREELMPGIWGSWSSWSNYSGDPVLEHLFTSLDDGSFFNYQIRTKCGITNSINVNGWFHTLSGGAIKKSSGVVEKAGDVDKLNVERTAGDDSALGIQLVPNPAREFVAINLNGFDTRAKQIVMMDLQGKLIFRVMVSREENNPELDLVKLKLKEGAYIIHVDDGVNRKTEKLIIQR
ncbi:MAG: HYR domain-containing protein [Saprospiraceae bacterium]|nr:HYR domain-containing protein [Saprospiraceae bacterium]